MIEVNLDEFVGTKLPTRIDEPGNRTTTANLSITHHLTESAVVKIHQMSSQALTL